MAGRCCTSFIPTKPRRRSSDGTFVTFTDEKNAMRPGIMDVLNEWGPEGATMDKVVAATDDAEKEKLMRGYLATLKNTDQVVKRWMLDVKLVLDRLPKSGAGVGAVVAARSVAARRRRPFDGRRDGGAVLRRGSALQGGTQLDGIPQYGTMIDTPMPAPFLMVYSGRPGRAGASDLIYRRSASKYYRVDVADTLHIDFIGHEMLGRAAAPARRVRQDRAGARGRADAPDRARVLRPGDPRPTVASNER